MPASICLLAALLRCKQDTSHSPDHRASWSHAFPVKMACISTNEPGYSVSLPTLTHPNHTHYFSPNLSCSAKNCGILPSSRSPTLGNSFHFTFQMNSKSYHFSSHPPILRRHPVVLTQELAEYHPVVSLLYHNYKVLFLATWPFVLWALPISHLFF